MTPTLQSIEALWFEPGTAADAAHAANNWCNKGRPYTAHGVNEIWQRAKRHGRLPPFTRPPHGFSGWQRKILKMFFAQKRTAA